MLIDLKRRVLIILTCLIFFNCVDKNNIAVLFTGDSLIYGWDTFFYFPEVETANTGIKGSTVCETRTRLLKDLNKYNPEKLVLLIGTNDCIKMITQGVEDSIIVDSILLEYSALLNDISYCKVNCCVLSLLKTNKRFGESISLKLNSLYTVLNMRLQSTVQLFSGCEFIEVNHLLIDKNNQLREDYTTDGLHINEKAYELISNHIRPKIF